MFYDIGVLKIFLQFTGKYLYLSLYSDKVIVTQSSTIINMRLSHVCLSVSFRKFLKAPYFIEVFIIGLLEFSF